MARVRSICVNVVDEGHVRSGLVIGTSHKRRGHMGTGVQGSARLEFLVEDNDKLVRCLASL